MGKMKGKKWGKRFLGDDKRLRNEKMQKNIDEFSDMLTESLNSE